MFLKQSSAPGVADGLTMGQHGDTFDGATHLRIGVTMPRIVTLIIGALLMAIGVVWFLQGIGSLAGSPMTGVSFWAFAGAVSFVVGLFALLRGLKGRRTSEDG